MPTHRILIAVWPFYGHLFPNIAIAHALCQRGHEVAFYTGEGAQQIVEEEGFRYFPFRHIDGAEWDQKLATGYYVPSPLRRAHRHKKFIQQWWLGTVPGQITDLEAIIAEWRPSMIVCDPTMWAPFLVLYEKHKIPVALYSWTTSCMLPGPDVPPVGLGLPSYSNWRSRISGKIIGALMHVLTADIRRNANKIRRCHNLPAMNGSVAEQAARVPLYLVTSSPELDYKCRNLPPNVHYVGPCLWTKRNGQERPAWLDKIRDDQPLVYVTEGTLQKRRPVVLLAAAAGLADLPLQVVITTGARRKQADLGLSHVASNIRIENWVPDAELIPKASVLVTAGGAGTVLAALNAGIPMVVVPSEWDKPENAQRVVESGAGVRLAPERCTPERLREAVLRVLEDPSFRTNARRVAETFQRYGGPNQAAELLEKYSDACVA